MAARFPLIANPSTNQIQEIPFGDSLDLTGNGLVGINSITVSGNAEFNNVSISGVCTSTDFNSQSDFRLKENINTYENALDKIEDIRGVSFVWKETQKTSIGVIAQEVEEVFPELVISGEEFKSVNYNGLIGVLIEAVKELKLNNEELKKQIDYLNSKLA